MKLDRLDTYLGRRRAIAARYDRELAETALALPRTAPRNEHAYYLYVARHPRRDEILERLRAEEILLNVSYRWPIHTMRGFADLGYRDGDLPHTERAAREIFSLPMYPCLRPEDQERTIAALRTILDRL